MSQLDVALIGYGGGGATFHAPLIDATPGLRLAAIVTSDPARRDAARARFPHARLVGSAEETRDCALVAISSPSGTHARLAREALGRGQHVVVDKPFAVTAEEVSEIADLAQRTGRLAVPFMNRRWDADFLTLRQLCSDGTLGQVTQFESRFEKWRDEPRARWCQPSARRAAEGIVYDIGSHLVDQALVLFGPADQVEAHLHRRHAAVRVEDEGCLVLRHTSGVWSHLYMSIAARGSTPRMVVRGTRGTFVKFGVDPQEADLKAGADLRSAQWGVEVAERWGTIYHERGIESVTGVAGDYRAFYVGVQQAVTAGVRAPVEIGDALRTAQVLEAAFRSADECRRVSLRAST